MGTNFNENPFPESLSPRWHRHGALRWSWLQHWPAVRQSTTCPATAPPPGGRNADRSVAKSHGPLRESKRHLPPPAAEGTRAHTPPAPHERNACGATSTGARTATRTAAARGLVGARAGPTPVAGTGSLIGSRFALPKRMAHNPHMGLEVSLNGRKGQTS